MREYYEHIKAKASLSMQDVIETCRSLTPSDYKTRPYRFPDLHNGVALLDNEDALNCYIAAYGEMHMIKCRSALQNFPFDNISGSIEIDAGKVLVQCVLLTALKNMIYYNG